MNFNKSKIISEFKLQKFGKKGYYNSTLLKCKECGRFDKFGINFELNKVHCFYDNYRSNIEFYLKAIDRKDLLLNNQERSIEDNFPKLKSNKIVEIIENIVLPEKSLPIGFKRLEYDEYLNSRGFCEVHYDLFKVGETKLDPSLRNHIIFQIFNDSGKRVAWMSRSRHDKEWHKLNLDRFKEGKGDLILRYGNSPNTDFSSILGGEAEITELTHTIIVVEGIMDKVNTDNELYLLDNPHIKCVFTFGNRITENQIRIINKYKNIKDIYLLYDYGTIEESKHCGMYLQNNTDKNVKVCHIKQKDKDPGNMDQDQLIEVLEESVGSFQFNFSKLNAIRRS